MSRRAARVLLTLGLSVFPTVTFADNCGSLGDCYGTFVAAAKVAAAIAVAIGIAAVLPQILGVVMVEEAGAAIGLTEGDLLSQVATGDLAAETGEGIEFIGRGFASPEELLGHFTDHMGKFGYSAPEQYLEGARQLTSGGEGIETWLRNNADTLLYNPETNEFAVVSKDNVIRTYFKPIDSINYWLDQMGGGSRG